MVLGAAVAASANAYDWGDLAVISSTLSNNVNRLCLGVPASMRPADIGCPSYAPYVSAAGNVGIGTTAPSNTLHVSGTLRLADGGEPCDTHRAGAIRYTSSSVFQFCMGSGWQNLSDAAGGGQADRITSGTTSVIATQDRSVTISTSGTERLVIGENGNVGIGTSSPLEALQVNGKVLVGSGLGAASRAAGITLNTAAGYNTLGFGAPGSWFIGLYANDINQSLNITDARSSWPGTARVTFFRSGNVGIGTTSPQATLQVSGSFIVSTSAQTTTPSLYVGTNGNVGIGTSNPTHKLHVIGNISNQSYGGVYTELLYSAGATQNNYMAGRLGIGTTNPTRALDVSGSANISGTVKVAGTGGEPCAAGTFGTIRYNAATQTFQMCRP